MMAVAVIATAAAQATNCGRANTPPYASSGMGSWAWRP
jgi:hypothetical protein